MVSRSGGGDRISTRAKLARELVTLGNVISDARAARRVKQNELAQRLGMPASYLSKIESGTRRLDVVEFVRIAEAMGADPRDLIADLQRALASPRQPSDSVENGK